MKATHRALLFWGVCIPLRLYLSTRKDSAWLRIFAGVIGVRWISELENGTEGVFGGPAFWANQRPMHGYLWLLYSVSNNNTFLLFDTLFGAANWLHYHS